MNDEPHGERDPAKICGDSAHLRADAKMIAMVARARQRGIPQRLADKVYKKTEELIDGDGIKASTIAKIIQAVAVFAKVDIETERYQAGESGTQINITQQTAIIHQADKISNDVAAMDASMLPPSKVYGAFGKLSQNGHDCSSSTDAE